MPIIGLTGGIGSGKSLAATQFASLGVPVVDTDRIAHALTAKNMPMVGKIAALFGQACLDLDGSLNRAALRQLVFSSDMARQELEALLHPAIHAEALKALATNAQFLNNNQTIEGELPSYQLLVVPLLFETNHYADVVSQTIVIDCTEDLQIARVHARSGNKMTVTDVQAIIAAQLSRQARLAKADLVISNNDTPEALMLAVRATHTRLNKNCTKNV